MLKFGYFGTKLFSIKVKFSKKSIFVKVFVVKRSKCVDVWVLKVKMCQNFQFESQYLTKFLF